MKNVSVIISWLFLPLFTPLYALLIVFFVPALPKSYALMDSLFFYPADIKLLYLLLFFVFITVAPGMSLIVLRLNNSISSLSLSKQEERGSPILIMVFYTAVLYLFMIYQNENSLVPSLIKGMALGGFVASGLAYFINKIEKISLHGIGLGALVGFIYVYFLSLEEYSLWVFLLLILLSGLVLSARLKLKEHNLKQIALGFLLGFGSQFFCVYFYP